jgi:hypothetical protein
LWLLPSHKKYLTYRPLNDIDFTSARKKKKKLFDDLAETYCESQSNSSTHLSQLSLSRSSVVPQIPSNDEIRDFYVLLNSCKKKPVLLSLVWPYSDSYSSHLVEQIRTLTSLYSTGNLAFSIAELITLSDAVDITLTSNDVESIDVATRVQSANKTWYDYRAGRITASKMKYVCCTKVCDPSIVFLKLSVIHVTCSSSQLQQNGVVIMSI